MIVITSADLAHSGRTSGGSDFNGILCC